MKILYTFFILIFIFHLSFSASYKLVNKDLKDENKTKNYSISVQYPEMQGYNDNFVQDDFNKYVYDLVKKSVDDFKKDMMDWESHVDFQSDFEIGNTIFIQNENIISFRFDGYQYYSGSAHPSTFFISINYSLKDKGIVSFPSLFKGDYLKLISDICIKDLIRQKNEYAPDNNDVSWINQGAGPKDENFHVFNISDTTLHITFPVYQVASYAEGPKEVDIRLPKIVKLLNNDGALGYLVR